MNTRLIVISGSILVALSVAVTTNVADAGNGNSAGYLMQPAVQQPTGTGHQTRDKNQYRNQHQKRQRQHNGNTNWNMESADSGKGQYSNDKYLNQKDFQAWLYQNLEQSGQQPQYQGNIETIAGDGL
jgi:hypothetical protein